MTRRIHHPAPAPVVPVGAWSAVAACTSHPDLPWTVDTTELAPAWVTAMARVCAGCPVFGSCLAYAADHATGGYWAGADRDTLTTAGTGPGTFTPARAPAAVTRTVPDPHPAPAPAVRRPAARGPGKGLALVPRPSPWWHQPPLWGAA